MTEYNFPTQLHVPSVVAAFTVVGKPTPWQRATPTYVLGKLQVLKPKATRVYQKAVRNVATLSLPRDWPLNRRYRLRVGFYGTFGDASNVLKSVEDALNKVAWNDDRQVDDTSSYRLKSGPPRTEIRIEVLS